MLLACKRLRLFTVFILNKWDRFVNIPNAKEWQSFLLLCPNTRKNRKDIDITVKIIYSLDRQQEGTGVSAGCLKKDGNVYDLWTFEKGIVYEKCDT